MKKILYKFRSIKAVMCEQFNYKYGFKKNNSCRIS